MPCHPAAAVTVSRIREDSVTDVRASTAVARGAAQEPNLDGYASIVLPAADQVVPVGPKAPTLQHRDNKCRWC